MFRHILNNFNDMNNLFIISTVQLNSSREKISWKTKWRRGEIYSHLHFWKVSLSCYSSADGKLYVKLC